MSRVTVGIDIGTSSVKAVAADDDGNVVASARVPHPVLVPTATRFEHDADLAWRAGPRSALAALGDLDVVGVSVSAMVPSLAAVDAEGAPSSPGLLYGDDRGNRVDVDAGADPHVDAGADPHVDAGADPHVDAGADRASAGFVGFLAWLARSCPDAHGYWPAQALANHALSGEAVLDTTTAALAHPLFDWTGWDERRARDLGVRVGQLPRLVPTGWEAGRLEGGAALASGCVDAFAEQLVAGADAEGDVLVMLGTTLIVWVVVATDAPVPGYVTVPHSAPGLSLVGGPSNAGGLFRDWVGRLVRDDPRDEPHPDHVPVWAPYPRGERVPLDDPDRRAGLGGLDLTHGPGAVRRAADEASAFVVRRVLDAARAHAAAKPRRIVASGGGTRAGGWVDALADVTGLPVDCVAVPDGAALGSAWLARIAAGLEEPTAMTEARRWARTGRTVVPRDEWVAAVGPRYARFLELSAAAGG